MVLSGSSSVRASAEQLGEVGRERIVLGLDLDLLVDLAELDGQLDLHFSAGFEVVTGFLNGLQKLVPCRLELRPFLVLTTDGQKLHRVNGDADRQVDEATVRIVADVQPQLGAWPILCLRATVVRARGSSGVGFGGGVEIENTNEMAPSLGFG